MRHRAGLAACAAGALLLAVYLLTLAPDVTFWDAGELIAAIERWGIPHPPGTPLYVTLGRAWREIVPVASPAVAANALSAVSTAAACALLGGTLAARLDEPRAAAAAMTIGAGVVTSVWLVATEAEVYAVALLLAAAMLAVAAARTVTAPRRAVLLAYLFALAAPLHASALVAGPAAVVLCAGSEPDRRRRRNLALVTTVALITAGGVATGRWWLALAGGAALLSLAARRQEGAAPSLPLLALGASPLLVMLLRARLDPAINQGNPATWSALLDVVAREQYAVAPLWPREAPLWMQVANFFQYADWQYALGIAPETSFSPARVAFTVVYAALGVVGARAQARADRAGFRAMGTLVLSASLGVVAYLNLKAGPSIGWGILPDAMPHEARERDYFFVLAFWGWGAWAALGALHAARASGARGPLLVAAAAVLLPILTNWRATDRRREPDAGAARAIAEAMLAPLPPRAVLISWGDNDSYPLWYAQRALGLREDVTVVTAPLLGAGWYREELLRRDSLDAGPPASERAMVARVVAAARARGRPAAFSVLAVAAARRAAGGEWTICGATWIERNSTCAASSLDASRAMAVPTRFTDPVVATMLRALECGLLAGPGTPPRPATDSLAAICNVR